MYPHSFSPSSFRGQTVAEPGFPFWLPGPLSHQGKSWVEGMVGARIGRDGRLSTGEMMPTLSLEEIDRGTVGWYGKDQTPSARHWETFSLGLK